MQEIQFESLDRTEYAKKANKLPVVISNNLSFYLGQSKEVADCLSHCFTVLKKRFAVNCPYQEVTAWTGDRVLGEH